MNDIEDFISPKQYEDIKQFIPNNLNIITEWSKFSSKFQRLHKYTLTKQMLRHVYIREINPVPPRELIKKASRSQNGILNVCVFTSPYPEYTDDDGVTHVQKFSCKHNCYYCPDEPGQPRSYLMKEPGVARANECEFDCIRQFHHRLDQYKSMGHYLDKIEFEISGGTWSEYPIQYQHQFIRDGYFAANTYGSPSRQKFSLDREISLNENASIHIIGLTIETRPDTINLNELKLFRSFNVTRVQIGVQHTSNIILRKINRGHTVEQSKDAIKLLLDNGFKVDIHLMPMLPLSTPEIDKQMFNEVLYNPDLQVDQWKVYPTSVVPWSVLQSWYSNGKYVPYSMDKLFDVLTYMKLNVHPRIRLIRIVRDINSEYIQGGCNVTHLRQILLEKLQHVCKCIRCRSSKDDHIDKNAKIKIERFKSSGANEYFIRYVSKDEQILYGFCRLRLPKINSLQLPEIQNHALIRELHVYSFMTPVNSSAHHVQHQGLGKMLLRIAEIIAFFHNYKHISVISGVGVRNYYRKLGYTLDSTYMFKQLSFVHFFSNIFLVCIRLFPIVYKLCRLG